jgi:hypothetical protein
MLTIVATPEELTASGGWWGKIPEQSGDWTRGERAADKWLQPAGYYKAEAKRKLRRTITTRRKRVKEVDYTLPKPTLDAISKRLAGAELYGEGFWENGPRAAERYVVHRRKELGLSTTWEEKNP